MRRDRNKDARRRWRRRRLDGGLESDSPDENKTGAGLGAAAAPSVAAAEQHRLAAVIK